MKEIKLDIHIDKPVEVCFRYTLNSDNTPKYFTSMIKEVASETPARLGTVLKNTSDGINWDEYEIVKYEENKTFTLSSKSSTYHVKYNFIPNEDGTDFEYYEWVVDGELSSPTTIETLERLKSNLENIN